LAQAIESLRIPEKEPQSEQYSNSVSMAAALLLVTLVGFASAIQQGFLGPDEDNLVDEMHNVSTPKSPELKPKNDLEKDFVSLDQNGDHKLEPEELMFRQYATGCEPLEAQMRANDYMRCGDSDKDGYISMKEFNDSAKPAWAECVKESNVRRAHGFVRFFDADADMDGFLTIKELTVGTILLWGKPGEQIAGPLIGCADKNKDKKLDQKEFHDSIAAYNPMTRKWEMWSGTSDKEILKCMEGAFKNFDAALVFHATDSNHDDKISQQECYDVMKAVDGPSLKQTTADAIFTAADKDKDGHLNFEEFKGAGAAYNGENEATGFYLGGHKKWPTDTYDEGYGMSVSCHDRDGNEWRVFSDDLGKVKVTPTDDQGAVKVTQR